MNKRIPLGRLGKPEDLAGPVVFLLSDMASYGELSTHEIRSAWFRELTEPEPSSHRRFPLGRRRAVCQLAVE